MVDGIQEIFLAMSMSARKRLSVRPRAIKRSFRGWLRSLSSKLKNVSRWKTRALISNIAICKPIAQGCLCLTPSSQASPTYRGRNSCSIEPETWTHLQMQVAVAAQSISRTIYSHQVQMENKHRTEVQRPHPSNISKHLHNSGKMKQLRWLSPRRMVWTAITRHRAMLGLTLSRKLEVLVVESTLFTCKLREL